MLTCGEGARMPVWFQSPLGLAGVRRPRPSEVRQVPWAPGTLDALGRWAGGSPEAEPSGIEMCPANILALGTILGLHRERSPSPSVRPRRGCTP